MAAEQDFLKAGLIPALGSLHPANTLERRRAGSVLSILRRSTLRLRPDTGPGHASQWAPHTPHTRCTSQWAPHTHPSSLPSSLLSIHACGPGPPRPLSAHPPARPPILPSISPPILPAVRLRTQAGTAPPTLCPPAHPSILPSVSPPVLPAAIHTCRPGLPRPVSGSRMRHPRALGRFCVQFCCKLVLEFPF